VSTFSLAVHDRVMVTYCKQVFPPGPASASADAPAEDGASAEEATPAEVGAPAVADVISCEPRAAGARHERPL
jgi:hypothetical protein